MKFLKNSRIIVSCIALAAPAVGSAQSSNWDGRYSANLSYKMGSASVCPRKLPINIEIKVDNGNVTGAIMNNGGGNTHEFCKLYHNGTISGSVQPDGSATLNIRQSDSHSRAYSSYRISGQIDGSLTLKSKSAKYHPTASFSFTRTSGASKPTASVAQTSRTPVQTEDPVRSIFNALGLEQRKVVQAKLKTLGDYKSTIDGLFGRGTRAAIAAYAGRTGYDIDDKSELRSMFAELQKPEQEQVAAANVTVTNAETTIIVNESVPTQNVAETPATQTQTLATVTPQQAQNEETQWQSVTTVQQAQLLADNLQATLVMYLAIRETVIQQPPNMRERVLATVDDKIASLQKQKNSLQRYLSERFSTPIRPQNANLGVSAFRAADTFPKVPYYVPGTNEIGEMLVIPRVSDEGFLLYQFDMIDPTATYDMVRDSIEVPHEQIDTLIDGLGKIDEWTIVAQENGVNRRIAKTAACIPEGQCEEKRQGVSSTELLFQIYEDGSTAGRIQRNKGQFSVGYNMSVESSILLQAYMIYMRDVGAKEFNIGVMSDDDVLDLFN